MAYIKFKSVRIEGFMSIKDSMIQLDDLGLVFVKGFNEFETKSASNGAGKSAIFESIIWSITGSTSRNATSVVNRYADTGARVELEFDVDSVPYKILRTEKHVEFGTSLKIWKSGEDISGNTTTKSKSILKEELPSLHYDMLTSIIVLSQGLPGRLSSLKPSARKARLEELSSMDTYITEIESKHSSVSKIINQQKIDTITEITKIETTISNNLTSISRSQLKIDDIKKKLGQLISKEEYESMKTEVERHRGIINDSQATLTQITPQLTSARMQYNNVMSQISMTKTEILNLTNERSKLSTGGNCPTCNRPITEISVVEQLQADIDAKIKAKSMDMTSKWVPEVGKHENIIRNLENQEATMKSMIQESNAQIMNYQPLITNYESFSNTTDVLEDTIKECRESNSSLQVEKVKFEDKLKDINQQLEYLTYIKKSTSRKLRSFLLQGTVDYINSKAKQYSTMMFEEQGEVSIEIKGNNLNIMLGNQPFEELSGGESRRVDLILQLCQRDLARNESGFSSNILVLDEVLDYLDSQGVEDAINLIESKSSDTGSILVVSHKSDISLPYDSVMTVVKRSDRLSYINQ